MIWVNNTHEVTKSMIYTKSLYTFYQIEFVRTVQENNEGRFYTRYIALTLDVLKSRRREIKVLPRRLWNFKDDGQF